MSLGGILAGFLRQRYYPVSVFISYSTEDSAIAGTFKTKLEKYWNFNVFIAHDDLEPSTEWEHEIVRHLESCEVFLPLITENFHGSKWTDQESGIAFAKGKIVLPICFGGLTPYGFLKRYQAFRHPDDTSDRGIGTSTREIVSILDNQGFGKRTLEGALIGLENSYSFAMTRDVVRYLESREDDITRAHYMRVKEARVKNIDVREEVYKMPNFLARLEARFR